MLHFLLRFATACLAWGLVSFLLVSPAGADFEAQPSVFGEADFLGPRAPRVSSSLLVAPLLSSHGGLAEPDVKRRLRRVLKKEITRKVALLAREIIHAHHAEAFGTEIPFEADGVEYVARIEEHFHPPGGEARPWGYHPGVSVLVESEE